MPESADSAAQPQPEGTEGWDPRGVVRALAHGRSSLWRALGIGLMRASAPLRTPTRSGGPVFARAWLEKARIEEEYFLSQELSQNPDNRMDKAPTGHIELALPYDGHRYFTRQAYRDVRRGQQPDSPRAAQALVGYLALTEHQRTDLDEILGLGIRYGSVPILVDLDLGADPAGHDLLLADSRACVVSYDYRPSTEHLPVQPVMIAVDLDDLDTAGLPPPRVSRSFEDDRTMARQASGDTRDAQSAQNMHIVKIMQHVNFRPELRLRMTVSVHLSQDLVDQAEPTVSHVSLDWPTHTSLRALKLRVDGKPHPLMYNPELKCLEWSGVPLIKDQDPAGGEIRTFHSREMELSIPQPGDLYRQASLQGTAKVTLDRLLSGMDGRLFDATGRRCKRPRLKLKTSISTRFSLILDDAFGRRTLTPHQQMHFDEVIPSEMRIDDIKTALGNLGFTVREQWADRGPSARLLTAERREGPDTLGLQLYVQGTMHKARRRRRVPGGVTYRTDLDSGELRIYLYGSQPRESQQVVRQMNELRQALHERFDRLPARR